jgi:probable HAF family extracellular repeat protein
MHRTIAVPSVAAILLGATATLMGAQLAINYSYRTLDVPAALGDGTSAYGINNRGDVVGNFVAAGSVDGFVYRNGHFSVVEIPGASPDNAGALSGVNDRGTAVGSYIDGDTGVEHAFTLNSRGRIKNLPDAEPDAPATVAIGINNRGTIVGYFFDAGGDGHAFIYDNGTYTPYDHAGASVTVFNGINDRGDVVGYYLDAYFNRHSFVLNDGVETSIQPPAAVSTTASGINNRRVVVGGYRLADGTFHSFVRRDGVVTTVELPGAPTAVFGGINDDGDIAGTYDFFSHGLVATPHKQH